LCPTEGEIGAPAFLGLRQFYSGQGPDTTHSFLTAFGHFLITQHFSQNLAHRRFGKGFSKLNQFGSLIGCQFLPAKFNNFFFSGSLPSFKDNKSLDGFSPIGVRDTHRDSFRNLGVLVENLIDLAWVDVEPAGAILYCHPMNRT
jgi:hypothetical protein